VTFINWRTKSYAEMVCASTALKKLAQCEDFNLDGLNLVSSKATYAGVS
jgi:hypothetical protein